MAGASRRFIRAGRPIRERRKVERVQGIILEECYRPGRHNVTPSISGLRRDLEAYLDYYNHDRPRLGGHSGPGAHPADRGPQAQAAPMTSGVAPIAG